MLGAERQILVEFHYKVIQYLDASRLLTAFFSNFDYPI
jgi:hypothetical protein